MTAKGISIEMPPGADGPLLADNQTMNPFFGYINQTCNRFKHKGVEPIGDRLWLRNITDLGERGFNVNLFLYLMVESSKNDFAMFGAPVEVYNYPTCLRVDLAKKDEAAPAFMGLGEVMDTPYIPPVAGKPAVIDEESGEEIEPAVPGVDAVEPTYRPATFADMPGAKEQDGYLWVTNADLKSNKYLKGSICLQLAATPGVDVLGLESWPEVVEVIPAPEPEVVEEEVAEPEPEPEVVEEEVVEPEPEVVEEEVAEPEPEPEVVEEEVVEPEPEVVEGEPAPEEDPPVE